MKEAIKIILTVIIVFVLVGVIWIGYIIGILIFTKREEVKIRQDGYFEYIIVGENSRFQDENNDAVAIVGFTSSGFEQETIDIPKEIDGHPVQYIGFRDEGLTHYNSHRVECIGNLKKIYIYDNIKEIAYFYGSDVALMVCSDSLDITFGYVILKSVYIYNSLYESGNYSYESSPANIVFMNNYSDEVNGGYYRLDNIETDEKISEPPAPAREGYEFTGWYTEAECINAWDFDIFPTIEEETEFRLYAGWRTL